MIPMDLQNVMQKEPIKKQVAPTVFTVKNYREVKRGEISCQTSFDQNPKNVIRNESNTALIVKR